MLLAEPFLVARDFVFPLPEALALLVLAAFLLLAAFIVDFFLLPCAALALADFFAVVAFVVDFDFPSDAFLLLWLADLVVNFPEVDLLMAAVLFVRDLAFEVGLASSLLGTSSEFFSDLPPFDALSTDLALLPPLARFAG